MSPEIERHIIDADNPWPGLMPFTEDAQRFFHGRDSETAELSRLIRRATLTVLFGQSGLGKSSLLSAGLFPWLRQDEYLPVYVRLDVSAAAPAFSEQVRTAIAHDIAQHRVDAPSPRGDESLWEYFHRKDVDFWSARNRLLTPVLAFDQFEELFTLGAYDEALRQRCLAFLTELADLVENRAPEPLVRRLEHDPELAQQFDFARRDYKVLLAFREDFLPDFEGLRGEIPSIMANRMRLTRMNGDQARAAVLEPGGRFVDEEVADRIIRFVSGPRAVRAGEAEADFARLEIEPALLSVVCRELNSKRIRAGEAKIKADVLEGAQHEIIAGFYEQSVADLDTRVRVFVEDQLLTESGYRDSYALEDALRLPGVTRAAIDTLIGRRLLRLEERFGVLRIELTHDVLTRVVKDSRDRRQAREREAAARERETARRRRARRLIALGTAGGAGAVALAVVFAVLAARATEEKNRVIEAQSNLLLSRAAISLEQNVPRDPYAYLARAIRLNPRNQGAIARAVTLLTQRSYPVYVTGIKLDALERDSIVTWLGAGRIVRSAGDSLSALDLARPHKVLHARVFSHQDYPDFVKMAMRRYVAPSAVPKGKPSPAFFSLRGYRPDSRTFVAVSRTNTVAVFDAETLARIGDLIPSEGRVAFAVPSPDRRWIATVTGEGTVRIWALQEKAASSQATITAEQVRAVHFSPDGERLLIVGRNGDARFYETRSGRAIGQPLQLASAEMRPVFSADGKLAATWNGSEARVWDAASGTPVGNPLRHGAPVNAASFSADGRRVITASQDQTARLWDVETQSLVGAPLYHDGAVLAARFSADGRYVITTSLDGTARLWDAARGVQVMEPMLHDTPVVAAEFSLDGRHLLTASTDGWIKIWEAAARAETSSEIASGTATTALEFSADGRVLALGGNDGSVSLHAVPRAFESKDRAARLFVGALCHTAGVVALRFNRDATRIYTACKDGTARVWDARSGNPIGAPLRHFAALRVLAVSDDGRRLATASEDRTARVWEAESGRPQGLPMRHAGSVIAVAFDPQGERVVTASEDHTARVWDATTGFPLLTLEHDARVNSAVFSPDGSEVLTASGNTIRIWAPVETGKRGPRRATALKGLAWSARYSHGGGRIVTASFDGTAQVWDASSLIPVSAPMKHSSLVLSAEFSRDDRWIITNSADRTVRVWDAATGQLVADPLRQDYDVLAAALSPAGDQIAVGTAQGVRISSVGLGFDERMPAWLLPLIEAAGGTRIDEAGAFVPVEHRIERLAELERQAVAATARDWWSTWARWFIAKSPPRGAPVSAGKRANK
ncbi:MAG: hypothetical protein HY323_13310 [Betaproteobacteria bacterium]|nr:hypothetical protein [Betaproteobacteria bacterium]